MTNATNQLQLGSNSAQLNIDSITRFLARRMGWWVFVVLLTHTMPSLAVEEPAFQVMQKLDAFEVRQYPPYVVAEVVLNTMADEAGNEAFPILAGYIFGKNKGDKTFAMTAPVTQTAVPVKMAMTAPVTQTTTTGGQQIRFVLPAGVTLATAPEPLDSRVQLREVPAQRVAVIRYSGRWTDANYLEHLGLLMQAMRSQGMEWEGEPVYARYDPPFMPWFLRRNEVWLTLKP